MPRTQGIRQQGTLSCLRVRKRWKRCTQVQLPLRTSLPLVWQSCQLPLSHSQEPATRSPVLAFPAQPPPHSRLCSHCHSALPTALHQCPSPAETSPTPLHQPVTCTWDCAFSVACAGQTNADFFFSLHCRISKQSEFNQATG